MSFRSRLVTTVALFGAVIPVIALGAAAPASGWTLHSLAAVGAIDSIAVEYEAADDRPLLHIVGWAGDLNGPGANGDSPDFAQVELYVPGPGGTSTTIARAGSSVFDDPRPDVARAYPAVGPDQGFEVHPLAPATGALTVCLRYITLDAYPWSVDGVACATVNVPAQRPAFRPVVSGPTTVGATLGVSLTQASGGTDSYSWWSANVSGLNAPDPNDWRAQLPGATAATFVSGVDLIGSDVFGMITSRLPGVVIEQSAAPLQITPPLVSQDRVASSDRYATSVAASQRAFPDGTAGVPVAYIASGTEFPDALSAGAAAAKLHGTLLLTTPGVLDTRVAAELVRLHPARIVVVGGTAALSDQVVAELQALPFATIVQRISGADRFVVSREVIADAFGAAVPDLYLVTGAAFPDALAAAAAGASTGRPVLLTDGRQASLDPATSAALRDWGTARVTIVGGPVSISSGIEGDLRSAGISVTRAAGGDRFGTAAALSGTLTARTAYFANGLAFPDALSTAVLAEAQPGPLLLTRGTCTPAVSFSGLIASGATHAVLVGGTAVQSDQVDAFAC